MMDVKQTVPLLLVSDMEKSLAFYRDGLGFLVKNQWEPQGKIAWCWLENGGASLMLQQACDEDSPPDTWGKGATFYFLCADAAKVYEELTARGIKATKPEMMFYGMLQTHVADPDGYALCFESQERESA